MGSVLALVPAERAMEVPLMQHTLDAVPSTHRWAGFGNQTMPPTSDRMQPACEQPSHAVHYARMAPMLLCTLCTHGTQAALPRQMAPTIGGAGDCAAHPASGLLVVCRGQAGRWCYCSEAKPQEDTRAGGTRPLLAHLHFQAPGFHCLPQEPIRAASCATAHTQRCRPRRITRSAAAAAGWHRPAGWLATRAQPGLPPIGLPKECKQLLGGAPSRSLSPGERSGLTAQTCRSRTTWRKETARISRTVSPSTPYLRHSSGS